ncbi:uncharacterized protein XB5721690.L [Xenopus laevis]|uniref:Uncharacterized protein XB5721690.L n=2 Tax=Xenopus laevis TaxID=8355 RepID=A0A1L8F8P8_XENLA|nr:uncharacterized protein XB5721690.L [Xenopus laevis]XP_018085685.1 uncharacterized protein XB5721690.L [Xenopus laevis]XP_018085686.1 uncharacterized protein XB5721690.L [Xenopus laevis]XP_018085687.1 uncharacterized protein XB5721690.L [Xenopus laevis]OCT67964.1 hypothetical protein XELAEV_18039262mg [Xenopus laevis]
MGSVNMVPLVHIVESLGGLALAPTQSQTLSSILVPVDVLKDQQLQHALPLNESIMVISDEHIPSASMQHDFDIGLVMPDCSETVPTILGVRDLSGDGTLVIENIAIEPSSESCYSTAATQMCSSELVAYLQTASTVPLLEMSPLPPLMPSTETVLSPAITGPITSTVPIVSKYADELFQSNYVSEQVESDLPESEMCNEAELVSIVVDLQKKVRAFQQRHRRHCSKLEVMEGVVEQLKNENLISEEKLNFLQVACLQSNHALPESGNSFAIICQEDDQTFMYSLPLLREEETETVFEIEEQ